MVVQLTHRSSSSHSISNQSYVHHHSDEAGETIKSWKKKRANAGESDLPKELGLINADHGSPPQIIEDVDEYSERDPFSSRACSKTVHESAVTFDCNLLVHLGEVAIDGMAVATTMDFQKNWQKI